MIKVIYKHIVNSLFDAKYLSQNSNILYFIKFFFIRFFYAFDFIRNFQKSNNIINKTLVSNFFLKKITNKKIVDDLDKDGFNADLILKKKNLNLIKNEISLKNSDISFKNKKSKLRIFSNLKSNSSLNKIILHTKKKRIPHTVLNINLAKTKYLKKIALSNFFINIAQNYINSKNISVQCQCFISNPFKKNEQSKKDDAQYFHSDVDFKKFFKVFIYLNKVDKYSGPHIFVKQTHKKKLFNHILAERLNSAEVAKAYGKKNIISFTKSAGAVIFEDTFGLHKGANPKKNSRAMLILVYGKGTGTQVFKNSQILNKS